MVDGVNLNPFNNKVFTADEIEKLDANKDGKVSDAEITAQWSWLAGQGQDSDGDVEIGSDSKLFGAAQKAGVSTSAATESEFRQSMATVADEYIEQYMTKNSDLTDSQRSAFQTLVSTTTNEFITSYLSENPNGPWDIQKATTSFETKMDEAVSSNNSALQSVNNSVSGYENNIDANYDSMTSFAKSANANKNVSNAEWNAVKNKAVQYLMGQMLAGNSNDDLLLNMNSKYKSNTFYQAALSAINELKNSSDPVEMQKQLTQAQNCLNTFLDNIGREKVVSSIEDSARAKEEAAITEKISSYADDWVERNITSDMSDEDKTRLKKFAENCVTKFTAKMVEDDTMDSGMSDNEIKAQFAMYIDDQKAALDANKEILTRAADSSTSNYKNLIAVSDNAQLNGNISEEEKKTIVEEGTNLIYNQLLGDMENIPLLEGLNANYKNTADFKAIETKIEAIKTSVDPDEIKKLTDEAKELISKMLNSYSGDKLVSAVDSTKPIEIDDSTKSKVIFNSSISSDYQANVSRSTSRGKQDEGRLDEIQAMAKTDLQAVAESMKAQLKAQLGAAYNEAEIDKFINDAINDTISTFTDNVSRRNGHGNYNTGTDEQAFVFLRRSGTKKGRYVYNLQALTNTFLEKFNANCKNKTESKNDPSLVTYDKENVIADSLGNDYTRSKNYTSKDQSEMINQAKAKLQSVAAALKASLIAEGCKLPSSKIDEMIENSMQSVLTSDSLLETGRDRHNRFLGIFKSAGWNTYTLNVKNVTDNFLSEFDKLYQNEMKK